MGDVAFFSGGGAELAVPLLVGGVPVSGQIFGLIASTQEGSHCHTFIDLKWVWPAG